MRLSEDVRSEIRFFAFYLANGTLALDVLDGIDYRPSLVEVGSALEAAFAVFVNVIDVGPDGRVLNGEHAQRRAAQWIKQYCDPSYVVEPPFEEWEIELG